VKNIYLIRHGESVANAGGWVAGQLDPALTQKGRIQARDSGRLLADKNIDLIVTSDLSRAKDTAEIIADQINYPKDKIIQKIEAKEINVGPKFEGKPREEYLKLMENDGVDIGEPISDLRSRIGILIDWLRQRPENNIVLASHAGFLRFFKQFINDPDNFDKSFVLEKAPANAEIQVIAL
jgi:broad specificity phosphatase PhoE